MFGHTVLLNTMHGAADLPAVEFCGLRPAPNSDIVLCHED
jgi:hypothetical protein